MRKGLFVSINNYSGCNLSYCNNDAVETSNLLEYNGDGTKNFDIKVIVENCTNNELKLNIETLFSSDEEIALFYFSGHGSDKDQGYLVTTDFDDYNYSV